MRFLYVIFIWSKSRQISLTFRKFSPLSCSPSIFATQIKAVMKILVIFPLTWLPFLSTHFSMFCTLFLNKRTNLKRKRFCLKIEEARERKTEDENSLQHREKPFFVTFKRWCWTCDREWWNFYGTWTWVRWENLKCRFSSHCFEWFSYFSKVERYKKKFCKLSSLSPHHLSGIIKFAWKSL